MKMLLALTMVLVMGLSFDALAKPQGGQGGGRDGDRVEQRDGSGSGQQDRERRQERKRQCDRECENGDGYGPDGSGPQCDRGRRGQGGRRGK